MSKWYPLYLDLEAFAGPVQDGTDFLHGHPLYRAPFHEEIVNRLIADTSFKVDGRWKYAVHNNLFHRISPRHADVEARRVFVFKFKHKNDYLKMKLLLSPYLTNPEGIVERPVWLNNV